MIEKCNSTQVKEFILDGILSGKYHPGEHLREMVIAKALGISQAPVREAIKILQGEGYLIYKPRCGSIVSDYSPIELIENYEIREALELYSMNHHTFKITQDSFIQKEFEQLRKDFDLVRTVKDFSEVDYKFHSFLISLINNNSMKSHWDLAINKFMISSFFKDFSDNQNLLKDIHINILDSLIKGNIEKAALMLEKHYDYLKYHIKKSNEEV